MKALIENAPIFVLIAIGMSPLIFLAGIVAISRIFEEK